MIISKDLICSIPFSKYAAEKWSQGCIGLGITGGAAGIERVTSLQFAEEGATVIC